MKRRRNNKISEQHGDNKKKLSITRFEDLSNELIYEIIDYFDYCLIYEIFANLNSRFHSLFFHSSVPLKINFPLTSKSLFQYRCKYLITSNINRIISLNISKYFLECFAIDLFSSLQCLIVHQIESDKISTLLSHLTSLPHFSSLSIHSSNYFQNQNSIYLSIFRLTKLKFCKLTFPTGGERVPLPISMNSYQTLEHLIINGHCRLDQLNSILSYIPLLQHLSCQYLYGTGCREINVPVNLTSICLTVYRMSFDELKFFLSKISLQLKTLRIKTSNDDDFFHADQWEQLISNFMPCLCIFDLQYSISTDDRSCQQLINRFSSNFWIERKWFFDYYYHHTNDRSYYLQFFSLVPYRYTDFILYEQIDNNGPKSYENNHINFARHLIIDGCLRTKKYSIQFPRVTQLTLCDNHIEGNSSFINDITSFVPLLQIKELCIKNNHFSINTLIKFLHILPNLQSLTLSTIQSLESIKRTDIIDSLSMHNRIIKLIIDDDECQCKHVASLIHLFPRLEYLEISINENNLEKILHYLLLKLKYLFSLFLLNVNYDMIERIQTLAKKERLINDYSFERIQGGLHLWW